MRLPEGVSTFLVLLSNSLGFSYHLPEGFCPTWIELRGVHFALVRLEVGKSQLPAFFWKAVRLLPPSSGNSDCSGFAPFPHPPPASERFYRWLKVARCFSSSLAVIHGRSPYVPTLHDQNILEKSWAVRCEDFTRLTSCLARPEWGA